MTTVFSGVSAEALIRVPLSGGWYGFNLPGSPEASRKAAKWLLLGKGDTAMAWVGVRELKNRATEILSAVREDQAEYVVTYHGRPVAVLLPVDEEWLEAETKRAAEAVAPGDEVWVELEALRQEIGQSWQSEKTVVELISEQKR